MPVIVIPDPETYPENSPADLLSDIPCLQCLSEKELLAVIVLALAVEAGITIPDTLKNSACFTCLSKKQQLQVIATLFGRDFLSTLTVPQIQDQIKCLLCAQDGQLRAAAVYLMAQIFTEAQ